MCVVGTSAGSQTSLMYWVFILSYWVSSTCWCGTYNLILFFTSHLAERLRREQRCASLELWLGKSTVVSQKGIEQNWLETELTQTYWEAYSQPSSHCERWSAYMDTTGLSRHIQNYRLGCLYFIPNVKGSPGLQDLLLYSVYRSWKELCFCSGCIKTCLPGNASVQDTPIS